MPPLITEAEWGHFLEICFHLISRYQNLLGTNMPKERPVRSKTYSSGPAPTGAAGGLGQHFIKNIAVVHNIVEKAGIKPTDIVLEIGPGNGILTMELLKKAKKVIAVELDPRMVNEVQKKVQGT